MLRVKFIFALFYFFLDSNMGWAASPAEKYHKDVLEKSKVPYEDITYKNQTNAKKINCANGLIELSTMDFRSEQKRNEKMKNLLNNFSFDPDCLWPMVKDQANKTDQPVLGFAIGAGASSGAKNCNGDVGKEMVWMPIDKETFMVAFFTYAGGSLCLSLPGVEARQGMLYGHCPNGFLNYSGDSYSLFFATQGYSLDSRTKYNLFNSNINALYVGVDFISDIISFFSKKKQNEEQEFSRQQKESEGCLAKPSKNLKDIDDIASYQKRMLTISEELQKGDKNFFEKIAGKFANFSGCNLYSVDRGISSPLAGIGSYTYSQQGPVYFVHVDPKVQGSGPQEMIRYIEELNFNKKKMGQQ